MLTDFVKMEYTKNAHVVFYALAYLLTNCKNLEDAFLLRVFHGKKGWNFDDK